MSYEVSVVVRSIVLSVNFSKGRRSGRTKTKWDLSAV